MSTKTGASANPTPSQVNDDNNRQTIKLSAASTGLSLTLTTLLTLGSITLPFLRSYTGAPYVASSTNAQQAIRRYLSSHRSSLPRKPGLIDLGSGSGEHVLTAARLGYRAVGVERNPWLVLVSRLRAWKAGLGDARFFRGDLWKTHVGEFDVVVVFGVPGIMERVSGKLKRECAEECVVCSTMFDIPTWTEEFRDGEVRFYRVGEQGQSVER